MGKIVKDRIIYGGIDSALQNKVGSAPLDTTAQNLSDAVNEIVAGGVSDTWRNIKINGTEQLGTATSSGAVDFVNGSNTTVSFNSTGNTISITADDEIIEITATDYDALSYAEKHNGKYYHITDRNSSNELDTKVTQTQDDSTNATYEVLLAGSTSTSTTTEGAKKTSGFVFNPLQQAITIGSRKANSTIGEGSFASGYNVEASSDSAHAEGSFTEASGVYAHAEGNSTTASGESSHAEGDSTEASGVCAHTEGHHTTASSSCAHAEGDSTTASGMYSHAEGRDATASGQSAHAEGGGTEASGSLSHAEGGACIASGNMSHAEGFCSIANHRSQHVFGEYNIADPSAEMAYNRGNYVEIVGNGASSTPSNARTLDWDGNEWLAGKLTVGANPTNNMDVATKQYADGKVDKSGDTMTGDFTIAKDNPYQILKNTNLTVSTDPANGVTSSKVSHYTMQDSTGMYFSRIYGLADSTGRIATILEARNMDTSGNRKGNSLRVSVEKDGTATYNVSDPAAFRDAIGLGSTLLKSITVATVTTYSISSNWTDFKYLLLNIWYNEYLCASTTIPTSNISNEDYMIACLNDGTIRKAQIKLVDGTHISIPSSGSFSNITKAELIGII